MDRDKRGRARRVDGEARPAKPEEKREPPAENAMRDTRCEMGVKQTGILGFELQICVIVAAYAEEYARRGTFEAVGRLAGVF